jgi:hypothetical protein
VVEATAEELQPVQVPPVRPAVAQHLDAAQLSTLCHPLQRLRALLDAHTMDPAQAALCRAEYLTSLRVRSDLHVTTKLAALAYLAAEGTSPHRGVSPSTAPRLHAGEGELHALSQLWADVGADHCADAALITPDDLQASQTELVRAAAMPAAAAAAAPPYALGLQAMVAHRNTDVARGVQPSTSAQRGWAQRSVRDRVNVPAVVGRRAESAHHSHNCTRTHLITFARVPTR